jgi:hypothetical protein
MSLEIHKNIKDKLDYLNESHRIPNIIFHGPNGSGKFTLVNYFLNKIYQNDKERIKKYVMFVNCAYGKGIKFIREELKFFAKTHIYSNGGGMFKSIILLNADNLTMDAQSALRRCIELFSHTTRFFIVVEDKYKLLKPILSRFCEIYIPEPIHNNVPTNLYKYNIDETFKLESYKKTRMEWLKKELAKPHTKTTPYFFQLALKLYEKGYSGIDIIKILEMPDNFKHLELKRRYELLLTFDSVKKEFRNEKLLMVFMFQFIFLSLNQSLENISFM